jgi:hypothetical protein
LRLPVYVDEGVTGDQTVGLGHAELLAAVDLFRQLDRVALAQLAAHLETISLAAGSAVFAQGDAGDSPPPTDDCLLTRRLSWQRLPTQPWSSPV